MCIRDRRHPVRTESRSPHRGVCPLRSGRTPAGGASRRSEHARRDRALPRRRRRAGLTDDPHSPAHRPMTVGRAVFGCWPASGFDTRRLNQRVGVGWSQSCWLSRHGRAPASPSRVETIGELTVSVPSGRLVVANIVVLRVVSTRCGLASSSVAAQPAGKGAAQPAGRRGSTSRWHLDQYPLDRIGAGSYSPDRRAVPISNSAGGAGAISVKRCNPPQSRPQLFRR